MNLTRKQHQVLSNALAWCLDTFEPTPEEIADFFSYNEKGLPLKTEGGLELQVGWTAYYGDPFAWIDAWDRGGNPPAAPPAAWIYQAYFASSESGWAGWANILMDFIRDHFIYGYSWERTRPAFEQTCRLAAFFHGHDRL